MDLLHDWNCSPSAIVSAISILDDTLRDGLQSPSARAPTIAERKEILSLASAVGVQSAILGFPAGGELACSTIAQLAMFLAESYPEMEAITAVRTLQRDVTAHRELCENTGLAVTAALFVGCSPIRALVEKWDMIAVTQEVERSVRELAQNGIPVLFVTEDTTRANPSVISDLYTAAIGAGAQRICIADTVGHADPSGVRAILEHIQEVVGRSGVDVGIDWHGHNDRGLALANALAAADSGATRIHATGLGIGERTGNTALEQLIVNLAMRESPNTFSGFEDLVKYCDAVHRYCHAQMPANLPIIGRDAFRTSSGIHAAAILKAMSHDDAHLADLVYSSVPAQALGRHQEIEIGPMSGTSNVQYWLDRHYNARANLDFISIIPIVLEAARKAGRVLKDHELRRIVDDGLCFRQNNEDRRV